MRITLRHVKTKERNRPCTAIENIEALGKHPNSWMIPLEVAQCRQFKGTEKEAADMLEQLENRCTERHQEWENYQ